MRLKDYDSRDGKRVWLSEQEISLLLDEARDDPEVQTALLLAARCGLRRLEITGDDERPGVRPSDLVQTDHGQVVRIWQGKGSKYREIPAPSELSNLALGLARDPDDELVQVADSTIYTWVQRAAGRCNAETGDRGWQFVGPHDLRRSWGVRLLEAGVLPSVVMEWGGWEDWETFRDHYLAEFSPEALRRERGKVGWLAGERRRSDDSDHGYAAVRPRNSGARR